jgi:hypothetical protein
MLDRGRAGRLPSVCLIVSKRLFLLNRFSGHTFRSGNQEE